MLSDKDVMATIAVKDLAVAEKFYGGTLGLELTHREGEEAREYASGSTKVLVYRSEYAGTNRATAATWMVGGEIEAIVQDLAAKGVPFEHYDFPEMTRTGHIHAAGGMKVAWCKDPDGNILALVGE